jgi:dipeptidyl aminopeptidase/acylaminoacyl peptidase
MVEALRARGQALWYMNALNEGHGYRKRENRDIMQQVMTMFLREHLGGAKEPQ